MESSLLPASVEPWAGWPPTGTGAGDGLMTRMSPPAPVRWVPYSPRRTGGIVTLVIIDTTALTDTWTCDGSWWQALFIKSEKGEVRIALPVVVHMEFKRRFLEKAAKDLAEYRRAEGRVRKFMQDVPPSGFDASDDAERPARAFKTVDARLRQHAEILDLPDVSHQTLLEADLGKRKPFDEHGKGYRDALIWHTLLEEAAKTPGQAVRFVTANTSDFCVKNDDGTTLAPTLRAQAEKAGVADIGWVPNLKDLLEELRSGVEFVSELPSEGKEDVLLETAYGLARSYLDDLDLDVDPHDLSYPSLRHDLGIPPEIQSVTVGHVDMRSASYQLVDGGYEEAELWNVIVQAELSLWGFALKSDWSEVDSTPDWWVDDGDLNDHGMSVEGTATINVNVSVFIDSAHHVLGTDVESVEAA